MAKSDANINKLTLIWNRANHIKQTDTATLPKV